MPLRVEVLQRAAHHRHLVDWLPDFAHECLQVLWLLLLLLHGIVEWSTTCFDFQDGSPLKLALPHSLLPN